MFQTSPVSGNYADLQTYRFLKTTTFTKIMPKPCACAQLTPLQYERRSLVGNRPPKGGGLMLASEFPAVFHDGQHFKGPVPPLLHLSDVQKLLLGFGCE